MLDKALKLSLLIKYSKISKILILCDFLYSSVTDYKNYGASNLTIFLIGL